MSGTEDEEGHSSGIKTPKQLVTVLLAAFLFPVVIILLLARFVTTDVSVDQNNPVFSDTAVKKRIKPVGVLVTSGSPQADEKLEGTRQAANEVVASVAAADGADKIKTIYTASCAACHTTGAAGAPKLGDKSTWAPRIKTGMDTLYNSALKGKNAMPPKGGNASLSDADVKAVVDYMVSEAK
ncbi:Cytochrome c5 [Nitrosospira sp. Nl5]|uniref:c-type cytochrome n=1 Tax=Nitrosospira sp. Nl5 TaxID=200120 RepID=UPI0008832985|nr:c-type cytochrome [Nitrosospira sp. Nl5]SCY74742.1 Cytochrome c5 [Nitrosospira sp. Nl5]